MSDQRKATMLSDPQKVTLALRHLRRAFAVAIHPSLDVTTPDELDTEFQKGLEVGAQTEKWAQTIRDTKDGKQLVTRDVMGQDDDGTPNGNDYREQRWVTDWRRV